MAPLSFSILLSFLAALAATTAAVAQDAGEADGDEEYVLSAWADPAVCNRNNARRVTVSQVVEGRPIRVGTCVAIEGHWRGNALYASKTDGNGKASLYGRRATWRRVGLYGKSEILAAAPDRAEPYLMVGALWS